MARQKIGIYAKVAKVQSDAKKHVLTLDVDPDFWDKTPELVEICGRDVQVDVWCGDGALSDDDD